MQDKSITETAWGNWGAQGASTQEQADQICLDTILLKYIERVKSLTDLTC